MRTVVRDAFHAFSEPLEGRVDFMYLDSAEPDGLVTVGVGNLIDPLSLALSLPFVRQDGQPATRAEISSDWLAVKGRQDLKRHGGMVFRHVAKLRLPASAIDRLVEAKLDEMVARLRQRLPAWDSFPADAQLALCSWSWAVGPHAGYPRMFAALAAGDFRMASCECTINPQRGTIIERNRRNRVLLRNAARVVALGLDPDALVWPQSFDDEEGTQPELVAPLSETGETVLVEVPAMPSRRPPRVEDFAVVHPDVPLGRPSLDDDPEPVTYDLDDEG